MLKNVKKTSTFMETDIPNMPNRSPVMVKKLRKLDMKTIKYYLNFGSKYQSDRIYRQINDFPVKCRYILIGHT